MSSKQNTVELALQQIKSFCLDIIEARKVFGNAEEFALNRLYQNTVLYSLEHIGEYASWIDLWLQREIPQIPWKKVIGFRVVSAHIYHDMDFASAWYTVENDIPFLLETLESLGPIRVEEDEVIRSSPTTR